jgi:3-hydroxyisobutyrate dehydrogenase
MKTGFIGLGQLGSRLCPILIDNGYDVVVSDLNAGAVNEMVRNGATAAESLQCLAEASDIAITCLPSPEASEAVMGGDHGTLAKMTSGSMWIEMSTTSVKEISRMGVMARSHGVNLLEAPCYKNT